MQYIKASQTAEKMISTYQDSKMDTEISLQRRKAMHESMVIGLQTANQKELLYQAQLEDGCKGLTELTKKVRETEEALRKYEEDRCQQCHSSIN